MSLFEFKAVAGWFREGSLQLRYLSRMARVRGLRVFLRFSRALCALEARVHPARKGRGKRVLIIVVGGLGDCLLFDPLFRRLKEHWPDAGIDVFTACFKEMWKRLDSVDNLLFFSLRGPRSPWAYFSLFRTVYRRRYDIVADGISMVPREGVYPVFNSLLFEISGAPVRIGRKFTGHDVRLHPRRLRRIYGGNLSAWEGRQGRELEPCGNPYLTHAMDPLPPDKRPGHISSQIFAPLGVPFFRRKDEPRLRSEPRGAAWASRLLRSGWSSENDIVVGFTTETTHPIKAWPEEHFVRVLEKGGRAGLKFLRLGLSRSTADSPFCGFSEADLLDLTGRTDLGQMLAAVGACDLFFSCDTGPAHAAQALGVPTIVLFGPSNEKEFGPADRERHTLILPPETLSCRPCVLGPCVRGRNCVRSIRPDAVFDALMRAAANLPAPPREKHAGTPAKVPCVLLDSGRC